MAIQHDDWYGLYGEGWMSEANRESMSHPAKFARGLIGRIYQHAIEEKWIVPGSKIIDPFGGVGLGGFHALLYGMEWVGVELEQHHVDHGAGCDCTGVTAEDWGKLKMARSNLMDAEKEVEELQEEIEKRVALPEPDMQVLGAFREMLGVAKAMRDFLQVDYDRVSLAAIRFQDGRHICPACVRLDEEPETTQLDMFAANDAAYHAPPHHYYGNIELWQARKLGTGSARLLQGDSRRLREVLREHSQDMCVSSPPFLAQGGGTNVTAAEGPLSDSRLLNRHSAGNAAAHGYGESEQNLANMPEGDLDMALSSPPYADRSVAPTHIQGHEAGTLSMNEGETYGNTPGNLGAMKDDGFSAIISSPPYAEARIGQTSGQEQCGHNDAYSKSTSGQLGAMKAEDDIDLIVSSPPYGGDGGIAMEGGDKGLKAHGTGLTGGERCFDEYGDSQGQLGRMKDEGFSTAISSPPFMGVGTEFHKPGATKIIGGGDKFLYKEYGDTPGNLGNMSGGFDSAISSPPFEAVTSDHPSESIVAGGLRMGASSMGEGYGSSAGQLGADSGDSFWSAARQILEELYLVLRPGGHAIFVVKAYVKDKKVVPFPERWMALCEAVGFVPLHWHRAWVVEDKGTQLNLEGEAIKKQTSRKSFFRRLAEAKGSPEINWECVICLAKPE